MLIKILILNEINVTVGAGKIEQLQVLRGGPLEITGGWGGGGVTIPKKNSCKGKLQQKKKKSFKQFTLKKKFLQVN